MTIDPELVSGSEELDAELERPAGLDTGMVSVAVAEIEDWLGTVAVPLGAPEEELDVTTVAEVVVKVPEGITGREEELYVPDGVPLGWLADEEVL